MRSARALRAAALLASLGAGGCGSAQTSPDGMTAVGGLIPNVADKDAGLVAMAPAFDVKQYSTIAVSAFPVNDPSDTDPGDRQFSAEMSAFFQSALIGQLQQSGLFQNVVAVTGPDYRPADGDKTLLLQGVITRLGRGSQVDRAFAGLYGAGRAHAQADMQLVQASSGKIELATADRRIASTGLFGGTDRDLLRECFSELAGDLTRFLARLSKGGAPTKS
jgi:Domain of unknown function (DUF4410)